MSDTVRQLNDIANPGLETTAILEKCGNFLPAIVFLYDVERESVSSLNDKLQDTLGYSVQEFHNLNYGLTGIVFNEDVDLVKAAIQRFPSLDKGESFSFVARFNHKDGSCKYLKCQASKIDGNFVFIFAQNITEQIKFEEEALAARQLFDETEQLLLFGSWSWNLINEKVEWTDGMFELLEYDELSSEQVTNQFFLKHVHPEHQEQLQQALQNAIALKIPFENEFVIKTRTGKEKFVFTKAKPLLDKDGNVRKLVGITRDITAKKNFENELERNIRELNRSNKELEEFAYVASHDLHEPLRKVLTFSERLKGRFGLALGEDGKVYLDRICASADSMRSLIDNLLEFSKISRGTRSFIKCDLNDVLKHVLSDQELRIEETSTVLQIKDLPSIEAVPSELKQLFNNLIGNALKFRKKDIPPIIKIVCKKLSHKEKSDLLLPFNRVFYAVNIQDNGIGFESVYAEKIFEIFQRLHGKAEYAGSGIGLAICKKIVDNHDGIIYATSEPGVGSVFSVILPEKQH
jgi:signal transduction histidine kinase